MTYGKIIWTGISAFLLFGVVGLSEAQADILTFNDLDSWLAAVGSNSVEDFELATMDDDFTHAPTISPNGDLGLSAVEESAFNNNALVDVSPYVTNGSGIDGDVMVSMRFLSHTSSPADSVTVTLPDGMSAFAFQYNNYDTQGDSAELSFAGTNGSLGPIFGPGVGFFGVVDTGDGASISSFTFTGNPGGGNGSSTFMSFDNVRYGTAVPEPSSVMFVAAIFGFCGFRRRR